MNEPAGQIERPEEKPGWSHRKTENGISRLRIGIRISKWKDAEQALLHEDGVQRSEKRDERRDNNMTRAASSQPV